MIRYVLVSLSVLFLSVGFGQDIVVYGVALDAEGDPAPKVTYFLKSNPDQAYRTNDRGEFSLQLKEDQFDTLVFKSVQFERTVVYIGKKRFREARKNSGKLYLEIVLPDRMFDIFTVRPNVPDTLVGTQEYSIEDFEFLEGGWLILLTYQKNLKKGASLRLMDQQLNEVDQYYLDGDALELKKDFRNNVHLICEERVSLIVFEEKRMHLVLENRDYYFKYIAPVIDTIGSNIYFSNYSEIYPAFDYFEFDRDDSSYQIILQVEDTLMMELYRSEFKYVDVRTKIWAHEKQLETGIDKEIWVGAAVFTNSIYYEPLYAPLFKIGEDSILVFDHYRNRMFKYNPDAGFVDSTRISYHIDHRKSGWEQPLIQDEANGKVYAMFLKGGYTYLSEIDKNTGHVKKSYKLYFKYVERIKIINDEVFYIYRPFETVQKKYIYREKL